MSDLLPPIQLFIQNVATGDLFELPYTSINYIEELNNGSSITANLDYMAMMEMAQKYNTTPNELITSTLREIYVTMNGSKIWLGVVSEYNRTKGADGSNNLTVGGVDYLSLFQKRRTGLTRVDFTAVDPATIPWSLINSSQSLAHGDWGITQGVTASTGQSITISYKNAEIKQEIANLSNYKQSGSFDFNIDLTKKLNVYYPSMGSVRSNVVLDDNNILAVGMKIPGLLTLTNSVFVTGQGINDDVAAVNVKASDGDISQYSLLEDMTGDVNIGDTNLLTDLGNRFITLNKLPLYQVSVKTLGNDPDISTYAVGDYLIINIPEEAINYQQFRVRKRTIDVDKSGTVTAQLDLLVI